MAGITTLGTTIEDNLGTIQAAVANGLTFFDTAYVYGYAGECEQFLARALGSRREQVVLATKGGVYWDDQRQQRRDGRPETIMRHCETSLSRLATDRIDLYYLHAPDPSVPVAQSAEAFVRLKAQGKIRAVGVSNFSRDQLAEFHAVCPIDAYQPMFNLLQRDIVTSQLPWCRDHGVSTIVYWPLMKGLLAGGLRRGYVFDPADQRLKYPVFRGVEWEKTQTLLDELDGLAAEAGCTIPQLVLNWTIQQPGIDVALCGAKRPAQIEDNVGTLRFRLDASQLARIEAAVARRGLISPTN